MHSPLQTLPLPARRAVGQRGGNGVGSRRAAFWCKGYCLLLHRVAVRGGRRGQDDAAPVGGTFWCMGFCRIIRVRAARRTPRRGGVAVG